MKFRGGGEFMKTICIRIHIRQRRTGIRDERGTEKLSVGKRKYDLEKSIKCPRWVWSQDGAISRLYEHLPWCWHLLRTNKRTIHFFAVHFHKHLQRVAISKASGMFLTDDSICGISFTKGISVAHKMLAKMKIRIRPPYVVYSQSLCHKID